LRSRKVNQIAVYLLRESVEQNIYYGEEVVNGCLDKFELIGRLPPHRHRPAAGGRRLAAGTETVKRKALSHRIDNN